MVARLVCLHRNQKIPLNYSWEEFQRLSTARLHRGLMITPIKTASVLKRVTETTLSDDEIQNLTYAVSHVCSSVFCSLSLTFNYRSFTT